MDWTEIINAVLTGGVGVAIVEGIIAVIKAVSQKFRSKDDFKMLMLLFVLKEQGRRFISDGHIDKDEYNAFCAAYKLYKDVGGDGWADKLKKTVDGLPFSEN